MSKISRRNLIGIGTGAAIGATALLHKNGSAIHAAPAENATPAADLLRGALLPTRELGETGMRVTIFGLGGASAKTPLSNGPHEDAVKIVERALDLGVNYFDTADSYGPGKSERALGEVAKNRRAEMIIASKCDARDYDGAMRALEGSLKRLQTDHLDAWLMHAISLDDRDTQPFFAENGAMKALQKAKDEKMVRHVGISGHHRSDILGAWLQRYPFEVMLAQINAVDKHHADSFIENLLPVAMAQKVGVVAMKVPAYGRLLDKKAEVTIQHALHYSLSQQNVACAVIACDSIAMLEENVKAARTITAPMTRDEQSALEAKTKDYWQRAVFYRDWH